MSEASERRSGLFTPSPLPPTPHCSGDHLPVPSTLAITDLEQQHGDPALGRAWLRGCACYKPQKAGAREFKPTPLR